MTPAPTSEWGRRLSDALRATLESDDLARARRLVLEGDGQTRSLAKEYTFMYRGLGITIQVLLRLLAGLPGGVSTAPMVRRFSDDIARLSLMQSDPEEARVLEQSGAWFEREQARIADEILHAIDAADCALAIALLEAKNNQYLQLHDRLVSFMAESFAWVLQHHGPAALLEFHLATAEGQRAGFDKWERMPAAEFAWTSAFLLKQHMGQVSVREDAEKFTIEQTPCGSGGRLQLTGAYAGPQALPFVEAPGPLTFGEPRLPVYCSHCPVWNGVAPLRWFGRAHWVFENAARPDGSCTLHIYKKHDGTPPAYADRLARAQGDE